MKRRVCSTILASLMLFSQPTAAQAVRIFQGHVLDGALAGDSDIIQGHMTDSAAGEGEIFQGHIVDGVLTGDGGTSDIFQGHIVDGALEGRTFTVVFNPNGAGASVDVTEKTVANGTVYGDLPVPSRYGYLFRGWYSFVSGRWVTSATVARLTADETLYAQWSAASYTVAFDARGGDAAGFDSKSVAYGDFYGVLPFPERDGWTFDGWFTLPDGGEAVTSATRVEQARDHTLYARWTELPAPESGARQVFADVPETSSYYSAVCWAVQRGITSGTSPETFSPNDPCKRKHILTFLWRANGSPEPVVTNSLSGLTAFSGADFGRGTLWACEEALITTEEAGYEEIPSTRAEAVTYLWKLAGSPAIGRRSLSEAVGQFTDVDPNAAYAQAVAWALDHGITNGTTSTTFSPDRTCTRGQIVTFLYRCYTGG